MVIGDNPSSLRIILIGEEKRRGEKRFASLHMAEIEKKHA
jgi:hypothetical protein